MATLREASFKGVSFRIEEADGEIGRRTVLHEFPFRDIPQGEDMGRAARTFNITALFVDWRDPVTRRLHTAEYAAQRFIDVLEEAGAGVLVHPWHGRHLVQQSGKARVRWPRFAGGRISIQLTLVEAGETPELVRADSDALLASACDEAQAATDAVFAAEFPAETADWLDQAMAAVDGACAAVESFLAPLARAEAALERMINGINHIINAPLAIAQKLAARISNVIGKLKNPFSGLSAWKALLRGQNPWALPRSQPGTRPAWVNAARSTSGSPLPAMPTSLAHWMRRTLVIEAMRTLPTATFSSKADVLAARSEALAALQTELHAAPDALFPALQALRRAAADSIAARLPGAADVATIASPATLPALVLAYRINGNIDAADDLVARNSVIHPGFVPAGQVEVLRHG